MAATALHNRLLRALLMTTGSAIALATYGCDEGAPAAQGSAAALPAVPEAAGGSAATYPQCASPEQGGCCVDVYCVPFSDDGTCPAADLVHRGTGSGSCSCGMSTGPYDPGTQALAADSKGTSCCYFAGKVGCEGRPLLIAGVARVAELAWASGWASG